MFKRKITDSLEKWKRDRNGRTALLIEGPHGVGKTTVVTEFARRAYRRHIFIDFANCSKSLRSLFDDMSDLDRFFLRLQTLTGVTLEPRNSVIIFDAVQFCPRARQAIKSLVADGRYDYIETGAFVSIYPNVKDILIPSEEESLPMHPMDFEEFLWAIGRQVRARALREFSIDLLSAAPLHQLFMEDFRLYMLVGGMPQAVTAYLTENNFEAVDKAKRCLLHQCRDDFDRLDRTGQAVRLFNAVPHQLARGTSRFAVSSVLPHKRPSDAYRLIRLLTESQTVTQAHPTNGPGWFMTTDIDPDRFRLFLADTGLFVTLMFMDKPFSENPLYKALLCEKSSVSLQYLYTNAVAQMLTAQERRLVYFTFPNKNKTKSYTIDFLFSEHFKSVPMEIKASGYLRHAALDAFSQTYADEISRKIMLTNRPISKRDDILFLPFYLLPFLPPD